MADYRVRLSNVEDERALLQYRARMLTAAPISRAYNDMIEAGSRYGYLTTGQAIVFLRIDLNNPGILYYHLADPVGDVEKHKDNAVYYTAIGQVLGFTLRALRSRWLSEQQKRTSPGSTGKR